MDLFSIFRKTFETLRSNIFLFLPPLVNLYLVPVALGIAAAYVLIPILVVAANIADILPSMMVGGLLGAVIVAILALVAYSAIFAGWGNMNRAALTTGRTNFEDFKSGFKKYFRRVLVAVVILLVVLLALALLGLASIVAMGIPIVKEIIEQLPKLAEPQAFAGALLPEGPLGILVRVVRLAVNSAGVALIFITLGGLWLLFSLFWVPAIIVNEMKVFTALSSSFSFVKRNFYTVIGYISLYLIADRFTETIFPGGGGGGGGAGYGFGFAIEPALRGVFQVLLQAFFILMLYAVYIDRQPTQTPISGSPTTQSEISR